MTERGAIFLDRDNTIVADDGFLNEPERVALLPGAVDGLRALSDAGWPLIVVSNQSGIARGLFGPDAYAAVMQRIGELLAPAGVRLVADYFCPHLPEITGPCECRKPGTLLFRRAAADHGLDLARSWYVGDRWRDVAPAVSLGGKGVLACLNPDPADLASAAAHGIPHAPDLAAASRIIGRPEA